MSNPIKYSTGSESLALKKGNFYIGTGDIGKGPTSTTGYYNGITPPSGGYTIYLNKASQGPSIYTCANDTELVSLTNQIAGTSYTTANECFNYYNGQSDKLCVNRDYEGIITDGLVLNLDGGFTPSYPRNGSTITDLSGDGNNGTMINSASYVTTSGGGLDFDGVDDRGTFTTPTSSSSTSLTYEVWFKGQSSTNAVSGYGYIIHNNGPSTSTGNSYLTFGVHGVTGKYYAAMNGQYNNMQTSVSQNSTNTYLMSLTWDGTTQKCYINGSLENSQSLSDGFTYQSSWNSTFGLCDQRGGTYRPFDGNIYLVRSYDRGLSASEVLQNYNAQKGRFGL